MQIRQVLRAYCPNVYTELSGISTQWQVVTAGAAQNMTTHPQLWFGTYDQNKRVHRCSQLLTEFRQNCLWNSGVTCFYKDEKLLHICQQMRFFFLSSVT